ncbi:MAG: hypothetical protein JSW39_16665 [Desulfobacterales bacterium]|nr:MAG: hypothetical protein JSW39_16665 [Desulfobacterales bacterium]
MAQITLRGIDPELEREIRRRAKKSGKSLNRVILDMICKSTESNQRLKKTSAESLRRLAGGWNESDASEFLESIKSCEQIDEELWT